MVLTAAPANALLDYHIYQCRGQEFDADGDWARTGKVNQQLVNFMISHTDYFDLSYPKSTGKELFNGQYVQSMLEQYCLSEQGASETLTDESIQASLLHLTIVTIVDSIQQLPSSINAVYVCGGGALNTYMLEQLHSELAANQMACQIMSTAQLNVEPKQVEALAFAWLAQQTLSRKIGNVPSVTGAKAGRILGGIYYP